MARKLWWDTANVKQSKALRATRLAPGHAAKIGWRAGERHETNMAKKDDLLDLGLGPEFFGPWGAQATIGLSAIVILGVAASMLVGLVVIDNVAYIHPRDHAGLANYPGPGEPGFNLAMILYVIGASVGLALILRFIHLRGFIRLKDYLALNAVPLRSALKWLVIFGGFYGLFVFVANTYFGNGKSYGLAGMNLDVAYLLAAVIAAPIFEETFFRGFMFKGLLSSPFGPYGTLFFTTILWTLSHFQVANLADLYTTFLIFALGLILGTARLVENSLFVPIAMHAMWNFAVPWNNMLTQAG